MTRIYQFNCIILTSQDTFSILTILHAVRRLSSSFPIIAHYEHQNLHFHSLHTHTEPFEPCFHGKLDKYSPHEPQDVQQPDH